MNSLDSNWTCSIFMVHFLAIGPWTPSPFLFASFIQLLFYVKFIHEVGSHR